MQRYNSTGKLQKRYNSTGKLQKRYKLIPPRRTGGFGAAEESFSASQGAIWSLLRL